MPCRLLVLVMYHSPRLSIDYHLTAFVSTIRKTSFLPFRQLFGMALCINTFAQIEVQLHSQELWRASQRITSMLTKVCHKVHRVEAQFEAYWSSEYIQKMRTLGSLRWKKLVVNLKWKTIRSVKTLRKELKMDEKDQKFILYLMCLDPNYKAKFEEDEPSRMYNSKMTFAEMRRRVS